MFILPEVRKATNISFDYFPTKFQAVVFRCWEMVPCERIASVLKTTPERIKKIAYDMGLKEQKNTDEWMTKGYITIIKSMWHLLPYSQLLALLGWDEERLAYILKEDDFLNIKLGEFKPDCDEVLYRKLTEEEVKATEIIKKAIVNSNIDFNMEDESEAFNFFEKKYAGIKREDVFDVVVTSEWCIEDFTDNKDVKLFADDFKKEISDRFNVEFTDKSDKSIRLYLDNKLKNDEEYHEIYISKDNIDIKSASSVGIMRGLFYLLELTQTLKKFTFKIKTYKRKPIFKTRYIYSFCGLYSDVLDVDGERSFPESLLKEYARRGINGVWIQAVLYKLVEFPFDKSVSSDWDKRLKNLKKLAERASRYGIKIYLYINEPRSMPNKLFEHYPEIKGHDYGDGNSSMCTLTDTVQEYLKSALQTILKNVPELGGFFCITRSENRTNCYSRIDDNPVNCPRCSKEKATTVIAKTIEVMANAVYELNPNIKFFAWDWSWSSVFDEEEIKEILENIPRFVIVQCTSEHKLNFEIGGIKNKVNDYTLSIPGPSEWTKKIWKMARNTGHECSAKVQINNSWECSTAPFLPVYDTILKHMENLSSEKVQHIMLSWTLGGYPSDNISIASSFFFSDNDKTGETAYDDVLNNAYGKHASTIKKAASLFSKAFSEFPFDIETAYVGPQNLGVANILFEQPSGFDATMTCYPYDDLDLWRSVYPRDVFAHQLEKLCNEWEKGLELIEDIPDCEFKDMSFYGYSLFKASYNQVKYYIERDGSKNKVRMKQIIREEQKLASFVYGIMQRNYTIGYEAANHYYVTKTMLLEKIIQCEYLLNK